MTTIEESQTVPLSLWDDGTIRVKGSRVTLDSIVRLFKLGETAEQIQHSFHSLSLREIYGTIYYYLENTDSIEEYLNQQGNAEQEGRRFIESHFDTKSLREKILARRNELARK